MMPGERGMHMDWTNVELVNTPDDGEQVESEPILAGLSASPSDLHGAFLTDLPHLQEAQIAHATLMATAGKEVEAHFSALSNLQTADAALLASMLHYKETTVKSIKQHCNTHNICIRP